MKTSEELHAAIAFSTPLPVGKRKLCSPFPMPTSSVSLSNSQTRIGNHQHATRRAIVKAVQHDEENGNTSNSLYRISRRQALQIFNGLLGFTTAGLLIKMKEQYRLTSPQGILSAIGLGQVPNRSGVKPALASAEQSPRLQEAFRYIQKIDSRPPVNCPEFPRGSEWINSRPLSLGKELKGKLVLLDFFTYCCINCQHVLPKLQQLESKYGEDGAGGFVVVGVHSAKFTAERETANIAAAVERYEVHHPVLNDERMSLWNSLGVTSWPTLALVGPSGNLLAVWSGEGQESDIDSVVAAALEYYSNSIDHRPLPPAPKRIASLRKQADSPLRYPGKVAISTTGDRMYVADSGNNRILEIDLDSKRVLRVFGSGEAALADSNDPTKAAFHSPQGLAEFEGILYVADTESHAVRAVDLKTGDVTTIGGNGLQGFDYAGGKIGKLQPLSSPWDVEVADSTLYVAMAGTHQIWSLELPRPGLKRSFANPWQVFSGTGRELEKNSQNGKLAGWAQPSHLSAGSNGWLYVADSESSSVRGIEIDNDLHPTKTIAGGDGLIAENLFAYGDKEGRGAGAKFQHPLAVCYDNQRDVVYVADSYNHRIKVVEPSGSARVLCGNGAPGLRDGSAKDAMFWEPAGLSLSAEGDKLYVSDTNNFAIRVVDIDKRTVATLTLASEVPKASVGEKEKPLVPYRRRAVEISCDPVRPTSTITFAIGLPDKSHFTPGTTSRYQVNLKNGTSEDKTSSGLMVATSGVVKQNGSYGSFALNLSEYSGLLKSSEAIEVEAVTYYCTDEDGTCRTEADIFEIPLSYEAPDTREVSHKIVPRRRATVQQA
ncbi:NHL repeat-containing protein 2 [Gracilariopsis chorda]|uniref:NHL repeat-containing protein 2 n=1 Tax=Gracilariopsis chorda TaxID=448386 RepID=A0A2V3J420_9FLOR|nr:NHL repeat-containing protein 2 [Gracilariopsis chorda]|eukprot:PXF48872.1 NHL repeat-containing protein 2 [Gracilariopsis chorda]